MNIKNIASFFRLFQFFCLNPICQLKVGQTNITPHDVNYAKYGKIRAHHSWIRGWCLHLKCVSVSKLQKQVMKRRLLCFEKLRFSSPTSDEHSTAIKGNDNLTTTCLDLKLLLQNFKVFRKCSHTSLSRELISTFNLSKEKIRVYF